jgi:hypothetical protein
VVSIGFIMDSISNDFSHLSVGDLYTSSDPTTPPELNRISLERDTFTDVDHNLLNEQIMDVFNIFRRYNEEPRSPLLLSHINMDKRPTALTIDEAEQLLDREPSIAGLLRNGWQAGSFKEVRQLGVFAMPFLSSFELLNLTTAILWPEVQKPPKRSVVPIEQRVSTCLRVSISLSHSILLSFLFS